MAVRSPDRHPSPFSSIQLGLLAIGFSLLGSVAPALAAQSTPNSSDPALLVSQNTVPDTLQLDDSGDAVAALQTRLAELGYYTGPISGVFGPQTEAAVIRFQQASGLTPDGIAGPATRAALQSRPTPTTAATPNDGLLQQGDFGPEVTALQRRLRLLGYYQGALDGEFGTQTEAAVMAFQRSQRLTPDGIVGPGTTAALENPTQPPVATNPTPDNGFPAPNPPVAVTPPQETLPAPSTMGKFSVLELQSTLRRRGFYSGPIDGIMGSQTRQAIYDAQRAYGLSESDLRGGF